MINNITLIIYHVVGPVYGDCNVFSSHSFRCRSVLLLPFVIFYLCCIRSIINTMMSRGSISWLYSCKTSSSYIKFVYSQCHVKLTEQNVNNQSFTTICSSFLFSWGNQVMNKSAQWWSQSYDLHGRIRSIHICDSCGSVIVPLYADGVTTFSSMLTCIIELVFEWQVSWCSGERSYLRQIIWQYQGSHAHILVVGLSVIMFWRTLTR